MNTTDVMRDLRRWWDVQAIFLYYGFDILIAGNDLRQAKRRSQELRGRPPGFLAEMGTPQRLRLMIEELGPTYVKLGQVVSSQSQSIPPEWNTELEKLQDAVPPVSGDAIRGVILDELKAPPEQIYKEFDLSPIAAASIGQVHRATLLDNQAAVVKVQRPNIIPQMEADISIMREVARFMESTTSWAKNYGALGVIDAFAASLFKELDYRNEGRNADLLRQNLAGIKGMRTPYIYWELVTDKVLTMERIDGIKINQVEALREARVDMEKLADVFIRGMIQQVLIDGFFHADVHPGNVFVDPKTSEIILLDLGMTGSLDESQRVELGNLMRALGKLDAHKVVQVILSLGETFRPVDRASLEADVNQLLKRHLTGALAEFSYARFVGQLMSTLFQHGVRIPSDLMFALKAIMQTEQIARTLNPDIKITDIAQTASRQVIAHQFKPELVRARLGGALEQAMMIAPLFGEALEQYLLDVKNGKPPLRLDVGDYHREIRSFAVIGHRLTLALLLVGTMIASLMAIRVARDYNLDVIYVTGIIGFMATLVMAVVLAVVLIWKILR